MLLEIYPEHEEQGRDANANRSECDCRHVEDGCGGPTGQVGFRLAGFFFFGLPRGKGGGSSTDSSCDSTSRIKSTIVVAKA